MELVHALNRGVDKRQIFMDDYDHMRFAYGLFIFNDSHPVEIAALKAKGLPMSFSGQGRPRDCLVDIHAWCLMGNHYHLLLTSRRENGIPLFLKKLNIGYAKYFNERHGRLGTLFQGRTKQVPIETEAHFQHILHYIHLNPLDFLKGAKDWRAWKIQSAEKALDHLAEYRWSSYNDYCGKENFSSIIVTELFQQVFGNYEKTMQKYLADSQKEFEERFSLAPIFIE